MSGTRSISQSVGASGDLSSSATNETHTKHANVDLGKLESH
ncbi:unnamed protein product [Penicillium roqueforti FM164]|uniref:Genomic scaffold, ProqFM164S03 n=1 Tax=Penicillium roqueforti (strain FM164) TaxID=1365484 RepID=W6QVS2_PENRF|nr:unnamed protein product [Penicillium roqueforti FM164]